jgi:hypothetical protein
MADKTYKVNEMIDIVYQAAGAATGVVVMMSVYDEAGSLDAGQSGAMTEIGSTGRYKKSFTPDAEGLWLVQIDDAQGGKVVKSYSVGITNISEIGATVTTINAKVDDLQTTVEGLTSPPMIG